ncbi:MAG: hypothetical protein QW040_01035 [Candidatus Aenigmatarchaeota archaeon]
MGLIRNIAKTVTFSLFSLFLFLSILTFFFYNLTNYNNAKNLYTILFKETVLKNKTQEIEEIYKKITVYCSLGVNESVQLPNNISLKCSEIANTNSTYMVDLIAKKFFDQLYFKDYECEIPECVREIRSGEDILVFFSLKAHKFFNSIILPIFILTIIFGVLLFLSIETWSGRARTFGFEFLSIGIFYFFLPYFKRFVLERILKETPISEDALNLIFNQLNSVFKIFLIFGLILIVAWIFVKFKKSKPKSK